MISVNMHEAKTRLSELVKRAETTGETIILCRNGKEVAEVRALGSKVPDRTKIKPDPGMRVKFAPGYDPAEPLDGNEWPEDRR